MTKELFNYICIVNLLLWANIIGIMLFVNFIRGCK